MTDQSLHPLSHPQIDSLSIVFPVFNEEACLPHLQEVLASFFKDSPLKLEYIFVNDGSTDATADFLRQWSKEDDKVKVLHFSRNFGQQQAMTAGIDHAQGDVVVTIDADLQDPIALIPKMIEKHQQGYDVVYARRLKRRGENIFKKTTSWAFYRFMQKFIHQDLPVDVGDYRLMSRKFLYAYRAFSEKNRFVRGLVAWLGFKQGYVEFEREERVAGETKYSLGKMVALAWNAALSFSPAPLRAILLLGLLVAGFGMVMVIYAFVVFFLNQFWPEAGRIYMPGWASIVTIVSVIGGMNLVALGVVGEYVARIFDEVKQRPYYVIKDKINMDADQ